MSLSHHRLWFRPWIQVRPFKPCLYHFQNDKLYLISPCHNLSADITSIYKSVQVTMSPTTTLPSMISNYCYSVLLQSVRLVMTVVVEVDKVTYISCRTCFIWLYMSSIRESQIIHDTNFFWTELKNDFPFQFYILNAINKVNLLVRFQGGRVHPSYLVYFEENNSSHSKIFGNRCIIGSIVFVYNLYLN